MNRIVKYIIIYFFIACNLLLSRNNCSLSYNENFFNDNLIGYYLSAIDLNSGESNVLLFDYNIQLNDCDIDELAVEFKIEVDVPNLTNGKIILTDGKFYLRQISNPNQSISFNNLDLTFDDTYLPGNVKLVMFEDEYDIYLMDDEFDELQSIILASGRAPNGRYYFDFDIYCTDSSLCNNQKINISKVIDISMPSYLNLITPGTESIQDLSSYEVYIPYPVFQWSADYCSNCSNYSIRICEYNAQQHNSIMEAINSVSILPLNDGFYDIGSTANSFQYPVNDVESLEEGKSYVWQVKRSFETTLGIEEVYSDIFIFKMKDFSDNLTFESDVVNDSNLDNIKLLIGESKYNELFEEGGALYNFTNTSKLSLEDEDKESSYLLQMIEMLNNADIKIIEVNVE